MAILKVSSKSNPKALAGAIAGEVRDNGYAELQAVGAGAVNQAMKGIAIARGFAASSVVNLVCIPTFVDVRTNGKKVTAMKFVVSPVKHG